MKTKTSIKRILDILDSLYPQSGKCFLNYETPWQLLFATIMSAQCTDERVNSVTPALFARFPTLEAFAAADTKEIEKIIHSTGFFRAKAKHLRESARLILDNFGGDLPSDIDSLTTLSGVGRKTANVVRGHIFHIPSIVVDTHVKRVSNRLGLALHSDPVKIEHELMEILPKEHWIRYNQQVITHGRAVCISRAPRCEACELHKECEMKK